MNRRNFLIGACSATGAFAGPAQSAGTLYVPPEEDPHQRTFMQWPVSRQVHPDPVFLEMLQQTIADIANTIAAFEPVVLMMADKHVAKARPRLSEAVEIWDIPTDDLWCRDAGPLFARRADGELVISQIQFNGWGGKQTHRNDGHVADSIAGRLDLPIVSSGLIGEAGGVEQDGHGLLIAHESSWIIANRNPGLDRAQIEDRLLAAYGAQRLIWAKGLRDQDITDYHIDSLARLTAPGRVLMNLPAAPNRRDPFHRAAQKTYERLVAEGLDVEIIPEPNRPRVRSRDFVAAYANYYACNGAVIAAEFGDPETDAVAADALARHYPGREILMLNVDPLGETGGGIHCATQQMPA